MTGMDPEEALRQLREFAGEVINMRSDDLEDDDPRSNELALAESFVALDEWLSKGGFLPAEWTPGRRNRSYLVINNTDVSGIAYVVDVTGDDTFDDLGNRDDEPLGFRAELGATDRILTVAEAREVFNIEDDDA